jgi:VIT1/CCC1 family predicted Fe2+/Mn2+ transporter
MNRRHFEVALEQVTQVVYEVWAESSEEAEEIATQMAMTSVAPHKLLSADVTSCCADEVSFEAEWTTNDRAA